MDFDARADEHKLLLSQSLCATCAQTEVICPLDDYSGSYVVVNYDGQVYPGKVLTDDEVDIEVNVNTVSVTTYSSGPTVIISVGTTRHRSLQ